MNIIINNLVFYTIPNTFKLITLIERDDGKKKQTLES